MRIEMHKECQTFEDAANSIMWLQELLGLTTIKDIAKGISIDVIITNEKKYDEQGAAGETEVVSR